MGSRAAMAGEVDFEGLAIAELVGEGVFSGVAGLS